MQSSKVFVCIHKNLVGKLDIILVEFKTILIWRVFSFFFLISFLLDFSILIITKQMERCHLRQTNGI